MTKATGRPTKSFGRRIAMPVFSAVFLVFCLNILMGKATIVMGWSRDWLLSERTEFYLLMASAILLMIAALARERERDKQSVDQATTTTSSRED